MGLSTIGACKGGLYREVAFLWGATIDRFHCTHHGWIRQIPLFLSLAVYSVGLNSFGQCGQSPPSPRDQLLPLQSVQMATRVAKVRGNPSNQDSPGHIK